MTPHTRFRFHLMLAIVGAGALGALVFAQTPAGPAKPVFENGQAQIVPAFQDPAL